MTQKIICLDNRAPFCPRVNAIGSRLRRNAVFVSKYRVGLVRRSCRDSAGRHRIVEKEQRCKQNSKKNRPQAEGR
jgi:hypothetical protein